MAADLTEAIQTRARADAGLIALLGTGDAMRFWPVRALQTATKPFVVWEAVSEVRANTGGGYAGISRSRVILQSHAGSHVAAVQCDRTVRDAFNAFIGASVVCTNGTVVVQSMDQQGSRDDFDTVSLTHFRERTILFTWVDNA